MSENADISRCELCAGTIDECTVVGPLHWIHCGRCGAWSAAFRRRENRIREAVAQPVRPDDVAGRGRSRHGS